MNDGDTSVQVDKGLFFANIDRLRTVEVVRNNGSLHHYRVQSNFYFRTNISMWPMNTERLEVVLEQQAAPQPRLALAPFSPHPRSI